MSAQQPTYEELVANVKNLSNELSIIKTAAKKGNDDNDDDDKMEASFLKAKAEVEKEEKEHQATTDEHQKVKDAFKKAETETDDDKKKEAMKKALEMEEDYKSKKATKKGEDAPTENVDKEKEHEAKIASIVMKKIPIMQKILEATKTIDPTNVLKVEKELTAATLEQVEDRWNSMKPFIAAAGLGQTPSPQGMPGFIPFQASTVNPESTDIFEASVETIDFSKVKTSDIMGLYQ